MQGCTSLATATHRSHLTPNTRATNNGPWHYAALAWQPTPATPPQARENAKTHAPTHAGLCPCRPGHTFLRSPCAICSRFPLPLRATDRPWSAPLTPRLLAPRPRTKGNAGSSNEPSRSSRLCEQTNVTGPRGFSLSQHACITKCCKNRTPSRKCYSLIGSHALLAGCAMPC